MAIVQRINLKRPKAVEEVRQWLKDLFDLTYGEDADVTFIVRNEEGELIASASRSGNVFKYFGICSAYQGENLSGQLIGALIDDAFLKGIYHYFIFTKPDKAYAFLGNGFKKIMENEYAALLEGGNRSIAAYMDQLKVKLGEGSGNRGAIVMNLNPMTLGHRYLIEEAAKKVDDLIVFIVEEDKSVFPFATRLKIAQEALADLPNVRVVPGGPYIISQATFPTYFLKRMDDNLIAYTRTDAGLFGKYYAGELGITQRFVGEEPLDLVTNAYNEALTLELARYNVALHIIPRKRDEVDVISASRVRRLLAADEMEKVEKLVVPATYEFLRSPLGEETIEKIKEEEEAKKHD